MIIVVGACMEKHVRLLWLTQPAIFSQQQKPVKTIWDFQSSYIVRVKMKKLNKAKLIKKFSRENHNVYGQSGYHKDKRKNDTVESITMDDYDFINNESSFLPEDEFETIRHYPHKTKELESAGWAGVGWYYWDGLYVAMTGPFNTLDECRQARLVRVVGEY
jgi:hypothetical protein